MATFTADGDKATAVRGRNRYYIVDGGDVMRLIELRPGVKIGEINVYALAEGRWHQHTITQRTGRTSWSGVGRHATKAEAAAFLRTRPHLPRWTCEVDTEGLEAELRSLTRLVEAAEDGDARMTYAAQRELFEALFTFKTRMSRGADAWSARWKSAQRRVARQGAHSGWSADHDAHLTALQAYNGYISVWLKADELAMRLSRTAA